MFGKKKKTETNYLKLMLQQHNRYSLDKSVRAELAEITKRYFKAISASIYAVTPSGIQLFGTTLTNEDELILQGKLVARTYRKICGGYDEKRIAKEIEEHYYSDKISCQCRPLAIDQVTNGFLVIEGIAEISETEDNEMIISVIADTIKQQELLKVASAKESTQSNGRAGYIAQVESLGDLIDQNTDTENRLLTIFVKACKISEINRTKGYETGDRILKSIPQNINVLVPGVKIFRISSVTFAFIATEKAISSASDNGDIQSLLGDIAGNIKTATDIDTIIAYGELSKDINKLMYQMETLLSNGIEGMICKATQNEYSSTKKKIDLSAEEEDKDSDFTDTESKSEPTIKKQIKPAEPVIIDMTDSSTEADENPEGEETKDTAISFTNINPVKSSIMQEQEEEIGDNEVINTGKKKANIKNPKRSAK